MKVENPLSIDNRMPIQGIFHINKNKTNLKLDDFHLKV